MAGGRLIHSIVTHLPGVPDEMRADLDDATARLADRGSRWDRWAEIGSLVSLSLVLMARSGTGDSRWESARQGVRLGALISAFPLLAWAVAGGQVGTATSLAVAAVALAAGTRFVPAVAAMAAVAFSVLAGDGVAPTVALLLVLGAVAIGSPHDRRRCIVGAGLAALASGLVVGVAVAAPSGVDPVAAAGVASGVVALLALGWFDPRYAVAAGFVCLVRLAGSGHDPLDVVAVLTVDGDEPLVALARLLAMVVGLSLSVVVAGRSLQHRVGSVGPSAW